MIDNDDDKDDGYEDIAAREQKTKQRTIKSISQQKQARKQGVVVGDPFHEQLAYYFDEYKGHDISGTATDRFVREVNDRIGEFKITTKDFLLICEGGKPPTPAFVDTTAAIFQTNPGLYGDKREAYLVKGMAIAVKPEESKSNDQPSPISVPDPAKINVPLSAKQIIDKSAEEKRKLQRDKLITLRKQKPKATPPIPPIPPVEPLSPVTPVIANETPMPAELPRKTTVPLDIPAAEPSSEPVKVDIEHRSLQPLAEDAQATLNACFTGDTPLINMNARGVERAFEVSKFFRYLKLAHQCRDFTALARAIAAKDGGILPEILVDHMKKMWVPEEAIGKPPTETIKNKIYRATLSDDFAEAIINFAYPQNDAQEESAVRKQCRTFLTSKQYWQRKTTSAQETPATSESAEPPITLGVEIEPMNNPKRLTLQKAEEIVLTFRKIFNALATATMRNQEAFEKNAEDMAGRFFKSLIAGYSHSELETISRGKVNGQDTKLSGASISRWLHGRKMEDGSTRPQPVDVDILSQVCDALAHRIIPVNSDEGRALAQEAAQYMAGIPWAEHKSNTELLDYVVRHGLDTRAYMRLQRRQWRLHTTDHARYLGIQRERYYEIIAPAGAQYAEQIHLKQLEDLVARQAFQDIRGRIDLKCNAQFRRLIQHQPQIHFKDAEHDLEHYCETGLAQEITVDFWRTLVKKLLNMHAIRKPEELAEAMAHYANQQQQNVTTQQQRVLGVALKRCYDNALPLQIPPEMKRCVADFVLPHRAQQALHDKLMDKLAHIGLAGGTKSPGSHVANITRGGFLLR